MTQEILFPNDGSSIYYNISGINRYRSTDNIEQGGFTGTVTSDYCYEIPIRNFKRKILKQAKFTYGAPDYNIYEYSLTRSCFRTSLCSLFFTICGFFNLRAFVAIHADYKDHKE